MRFSLSFAPWAFFLSLCLVVIAAPSAGAVDADGDGISDAVEKALGSEPGAPQRFVSIYKSEKPREDAEYQVKEIFAAASGPSAWIWRVDFTRPYEARNARVILYLDSDNDPATGRTDEAQKGVDLMLVFENGQARIDLRNKARAPVGALVGACEGNSVYFRLDTELANDGRAFVYRIGFLAQSSVDGKSYDSFRMRPVRAEHAGRTAADLAAAKAEQEIALRALAGAVEVAPFWEDDGSTLLTWVTKLPRKPNVLFIVEEGKPGSNRIEETPPLERNELRVHRAPLGALVQGKRYTVSGDLFPAFTFTAGPILPKFKSESMRIPLTLSPAGSNQGGPRPFTATVPFRQGALASVDDLTLQDLKGRPVSLQARTTGRWPDGSVKWAFFSANSVPAVDAGRFELVNRQGAVALAKPGITLVSNAQGFVIANGVLRLQIDRQKSGGFGDLSFDRNGDGLFSADEKLTCTLGAALENDQGEAYALGVPDFLEVEDSGALRTVVRLKGPFTRGTNAFMRWDLRLIVCAQSPTLIVRFTLRNNLMDLAATPIRSLAFTVRAEGGFNDGRIASFAPVKLAGKGISLLQDNDNHFVYRDGGDRPGERAAGIAQLWNGETCVSGLVKDFWQTYPKGLAAAPGLLELALFPRLPGDLYKGSEDRFRFISHYYWYRDGRYLIRRGLEVTSELTLRFDRSAPEPLSLYEGAAQPAFASPPAEQLASSGTFGGMLSPRMNGPFAFIDAWVDAGFEALEKNRRTVREYGWMNYGDWYGEREINWGNIEYDLPRSLIGEYARSGDGKFLVRGLEASRHNLDIDTIHIPYTNRSGAMKLPVPPEHMVAHRGGFFDGLTALPIKGKDYVIAEARFGNAPLSLWLGEDGVIDFGGHIFEEGNLLAYYFTGEKRDREIALRVLSAQVDRISPNFDFGIERAAGWPLIGATGAYENTGNPFFLAAAKLYVAKILEKQDVEGCGGWLLPQDQAECECPDKKNHRGGKTFATGVLLHGLVKYDRLNPTPGVKRAIVRACDWLMGYAWNKQKGSFQYKTGCPKYMESGFGLGNGATSVEGLAYASELSGDPKYAAFLTNYMIAVYRPSWANGKGYAQALTSTPYALPLLAKHASVFAAAIAAMPRADGAQVQTNDSLPAGAILAQAEAFSGQGGGEVKVRDDKVGAMGKSISHWDVSGHWLSWNVDVPKGGNYRVAVRYCCDGAAKRACSIDGGAPLPQAFPSTGGFSSDSSQWKLALITGSDGKEVRLNLKAGRHVLKMEYLEASMNLDYVALVPGE